MGPDRAEDSLALRFGLIFLILQLVGTLAQRVLGEGGFYAVSLAAGLVSSASGVAAAATLAAHGTISGQVAGTGVVLNSLASTAIKLPLVARISGDRTLTLHVGLALGLVMLLGIGAAFVPVRRATLTRRRALIRASASLGAR